ncbi:MAG: aspartate-semialdehyde dehydrogenase [Candidatus Eisenbacteria bacterium]|uniref:Aspartate-semialdehyde dehydrogenase n=1 Tax=Eiseniibacteriota bacterium TaxID=2212470 RepID=A0A849SE90_UNCEI|nr:aspartate-semialdehyde dehydrogenase [Candidatus Eisenbacteria bacterium]
MIWRVAILGATGLVGRTMRTVLEERGFPVAELRLFASERSEARTLDFGGQAHAVQPVSAAGFDGVDLALFACSNAVSEEWAPIARARAVRVVDNSSAFRDHPEIPLVVPEINGALLDAEPTLVANPNCTMIMVALALAPLARAVGLEAVEIASYQSVSGAGSAAVEELERGIRAGLEGPVPERLDGGAPFAFNVVPHIDRFEANGYTREEMKVMTETRKVLGLPLLPMHCTAVRVPVRIGHAAAVTARLGRALDPAAARELWRAAPGVEVLDDPAASRYPTSLAAVGRDVILVGRVRTALHEPRTLAFFVSSDNLRKGAATNAVQIAERLLRVATARSEKGA